MRVGLFLVPLLLAGSVPGRSSADHAIFGVLQAHDSSVSSVTVFHRAEATPELDLVLAVGGHGGWRLGMKPIPRGPEQLGVFLQDRARPDLVYTLAIEPNTCGCGGTSGVVERATASATVLSCEFEKSDRQPHRKFVYDVRAKALVARLSYQPFDMVRMFATPTGAVIVGFDGKRLVGVEFRALQDPPLRVMDEQQAQRWTRRVTLVESWAGSPSNKYLYVKPAAFKAFAFGPDDRFWLSEITDRDDPAAGHRLIQEDTGGRWKRHSMPRSTKEQYSRARPGELENVGPLYENDEGIGPHQVVDDTLWLGKEFYDSEGLTGVGGFGTFDPATREFRMHSPPELIDWSVGAMHVADDAVWMTLVYHGEYGDESGGLLRYDRGTGGVRRHALPEVGRHLLRVGDQIVVATDLGIAVVTGDEIRHFFVDLTTDGRLRIAQRLQPPED